MRYRRVSYSYTEVTRGGPRPNERWIARSMLGLGSPAFRPPTDFFETDGTLVAYVELAGLTEEEVVVTLYDDELVLEGVRLLHRPGGAARFHSVELREGPFRVELPVPAEVDRERVQVTYDRGLVVVRMPKRRTPSLAEDQP